MKYKMSFISVCGGGVMQKALLLGILCIVLSCCMTSNFTLTGRLFNSLSEDHPVKVVLTPSKDSIEYEVIGALQIQDSDNLSKAINLAKKEARIRGGDVLILISSDSKISVFGNQYGVFSGKSESYIFVVGKMK